MNKTNELIFSAFSKEVLEQATAAARIRTSSLISRRLDLRSKMIFTFGETPFGHAEHAFSLYRSAFGWQLGIHVADVGEYVCEGSPLDAEARRRRAALNNDFVKVQMLPDKIANELCDLTVGNDRLALSVLLDIDNQGKLVSVNCEESVIRVAERCIYSEIDAILGLTSDTSSVMMLRDKYAPLMNTLVDMYELAAIFCSERTQKGGLDCEVFYRIYERNEDGKVISFRRESEPDSRAMVRELGYFASNAIGKYMYDKGIPCIFVGQNTVDDEVLDYLAELVGIKESFDTPSALTAAIADKAKGTEYYSFICDTLADCLPCSTFSDKPIYNSFCAWDKVLSFVRPVTRYTDLLTQRMMKTCISASYNAKNLNLNRYRRIVSDAAVEATNASDFVYETVCRFKNIAALEYIEHGEETLFVGFPLFKDQSGAVPIMLVCGLKAVVPSEYAENFDFQPAKEMRFEIVALGTDIEPTIVKPV